MEKSCFGEEPLHARQNIERWKDETIAMVSHELRTPLSAMKNVVSILLSQAPGPLTEKQKNFLITTARSIDRLAHLLDSILNVSRISTGKLELNQSWIDLEKFLSEEVNSFKTLFNVQRVDLKWELADRLEKIFVDSSKLEQILINILSNAIKFTQEGGRIVVKVHQAGRECLSRDFRLLPWDDLPPPRFVQFGIKDTGIGMAEDTLANLFTRYYQSSLDLGTRGAHLGLNISRTLVEAQAGSLYVESKPGIGTEVIFYLPQDERTAYILQELKTIKSFLAQLQRQNRHAVFCTIGKESGECWMNLCDEWKIVPEVNRREDELRENGFFLWMLSEYIAVGLVVDESSSLLMENVFGGNIRSRGDASCSFDDYSIGMCPTAAEGYRMERLLNISLRRMKEAENFVRNPY